MPTDPYTFLKTLIARDFQADLQRRAHQPAEPLVVTLSRDHGAGGETVARKLATCLGIPLYDREILERVAQRAKVDAFKLAPHDEGAPATVSTFLYSLLTGTGGELQTYRRHLYDTVLELAEHDGLLVGRGAHLILAGRKVFRVRIVGSRETCAQRLAEESGISVQEAERQVDDINAKRHHSIHNLYGDSIPQCSLEQASRFDLVVNTDHIPPASAVPVVLLAMQQAGFDLRQRSPVT
ncbi:AAA family ATPase [Candidatus Methylocalor cossyra]|uniref:Cytidylate kinase-like family protein n=1 Tax=Candidatus Methylocalor cossyra TaxID=3108543 RepID=A0ABM9NE30_9GAMM